MSDCDAQSDRSSINVPRLVVAGTASGVGKTTFAVGLVRALRSQGLKVAVFKCGPDYLDPTYHARAAGAPSHNLDGWMMGRDAVVETFGRASQDADIAVIEGVMGLFDSSSANSDEGSTAEIAKWLSAPVLLVIDAKGIARSVAAIARGFADFDTELHVAGIIGNRVGSRSHLQILRDASLRPPVLGAMPKSDIRSFPERHLGLRTASEDSVPETLFASWGETVSEWCDLDAIIKIARHAPPVAMQARMAAGNVTRCSIGIAYDAAFHFYYDDNLRRLERLGAKLIQFSPISEKHLPKVTGLYIGGGYPEVHARELAINESMRREIGEFARTGGAVYAECGGLMYLCSMLRTLDGSRWPMCDVFPGETTMCERLQALGYAEVETIEDSILGAAGTRFRGHEFRYSNIEIDSRVVSQIYSVRRRRNAPTAEGYMVNRTIGSYIHAHWASSPGVPARLVGSCRDSGIQSNLA